MRPENASGSKKTRRARICTHPRPQIDAGRAFERLEQHGGVTLLHAVNYYVKHVLPRGGKKLVGDAVAEFLEIKKKAGSQPRYMKELACKFGNFKEWELQCVPESYLESQCGGSGKHHSASPLRRTE